MRIVRDLADCPPACTGSILALGNFDGVHLGHQSILRTCTAKAKEAGAVAAAMTFEPHPREFFAPKSARLRIYPLRTKIQLLREAGIDILFLIRFNREFASLSAAPFVEQVLCRQLAVRHVITGYNFAFGKDRGGDTAFLESMAKQSGFGYTACLAVHGDDDPVSSSAIRALLATGDIKKASALLGGSYVIEGRVRHGEQRGQKLGFPTANIALNHLFKPRFGVYAVRATLKNGEAYHAVANLGVRPTFNAGEALLEVHCFGLNRSIYGERMRVEFVDFIRDEQKFSDITALRLQIAADCQQAKHILENAL